MYMFVLYIFLMFVFLSFGCCCYCCCCCCYFHFFPIYLSIVIALLLLLLQLYLLILPLWVFLRNQVGESSKQGIQAGWSTPIYHVKWWKSRFRGAFRTHTASELSVILVAVVCYRELGIGCCESPTCVSSFYHYCHYFYYY